MSGTDCRARQFVGRRFLARMGDFSDVHPCEPTLFAARPERVFTGEGVEPLTCQLAAWVSEPGDLWGGHHWRVVASINVREEHEARKTPSALAFCEQGGYNTSAHATYHLREEDGSQRQFSSLGR